MGAFSASKRTSAHAHPFVGWPKNDESLSRGRVFPALLVAVDHWLFDKKNILFEKVSGIQKSLQKKKIKVHRFEKEFHQYLKKVYQF